MARTVQIDMSDELFSLMEEAMAAYCKRTGLRPARSEWIRQQLSAAAQAELRRRPAIRSAPDEIEPDQE